MAMQVGQWGSGAVSVCWKAEQVPAALGVGLRVHGCTHLRPLHLPYVIARARARGLMSRQSCSQQPTTNNKTLLHYGKGPSLRGDDADTGSLPGLK